jgi:acyl carrier protein
VNVRPQLERFLLNDLAAARGKGSIGPDDDLISLGIVDSLDVLRLVDFIEERFGIDVTDEDVVIENFRSINRLERFVKERKAAGSAK